MNPILLVDKLGIGQKHMTPQACDAFILIEFKWRIPLTFSLKRL